jgi:hypothetical protein
VRLQALEAVEGEIAQAAQFGGIERAQQQGVYQHQQGHDPRRAHMAPAKQPSHAHPAVVPLQTSL